MSRDMSFILWIAAVVLVIAGIVLLFTGNIILGVVLVVLGLVVGPGGFSIFKGRGRRKLYQRRCNRIATERGDTAGTGRPSGAGPGPGAARTCVTVTTA
jgi:hypothetical protein